MSIFLISIDTLIPQIIPSERLYDWENNVGVPEGIPNRTIIGAVIDSVLYGNGNVDASSAIATAIDQCPEGQVVYIPSGIYRLDNRVYRAYADNITIRGAGVGNTILIAGTSVSQMLLLGTADWPRPANGLAITAGAFAGSSVVTVSNTSSIIVGNLVRIEQDDLPFVIDVSTPTTNDRLLSATFRVVSKTATTVTLTPPIPFTFTDSPTLVQYAISPLVKYWC
ncbi:MAG: glycoside hydrolase family 55 protein [Ignavibacteriaceae bacterium]|nr:glycoside hydrolase family 55 protein [Ignavibacteriaceae bacterium]